MPQVLADLVHQWLQVLFRGQNLDHEHWWDRHFIFVRQPIGRQTAARVQTKVGNGLPAVQLEGELLANRVAVFELVQQRAQVMRCTGVVSAGHGTILLNLVDRKNGHRVHGLCIPRISRGGKVQNWGNFCAECNPRRLLFAMPAVDPVECAN